MAGLTNLLSSALNSNVGQALVSAGASRAVNEIYNASGFTATEVGSPTAAPVESVAALDTTTATSAPWWKAPWVIPAAMMAVIAGLWIWSAPKKGGN